MKIAIFDAFNGAGGDMILASLLDVGISIEEIEAVVKALNLEIEYEVSEVNVKGIAAKRISVKEGGRERSFKEVVELLKSSPLDEKVKVNALKIFEILARAEGKIHGVDYREAAFHEVGSDDAIFDIVCSVKALERLKEQGYRFFATPIRTGTGFTEFSHGKYPVPPPAVLEIMKNSDIELLVEGEGELLTPTAAAILCHYCKPFSSLPIKVRNVSYGAGKRQTAVPNVLRLILAETTTHDSIVVLETNIDDISGEFLGYTVEKLLEREDVLDVSIIPAYGKKMRPSNILKVIAPFYRAEEVAEEVMRLTGSLGVRMIPVHHRLIATRREEKIKVKIVDREFEVRVKRSHPGFSQAKPEFDDVVRIAEETKLPILEVYRKVIAAIEGENANSERK